MISMVSRSFKETLAIGKKFGRLIKGGGIIALYGDLGSGKTTFTKGFARGFGIKKNINSPTFVIFSNHKIPRKKKRFFYHFDLYRIKSTRELKELGFDEIISNPKNIVVIEWAEKAKKILPKKTIKIRFKHGKRTNERILYVSG